MQDKVDVSKLSSAQTDTLARVQHRLMAPCCYTQTIDLHMSEIAGTMRSEVASMIRSGQTETQIYEHYKALYGEQILAIPDGATGVAAFAIPGAVSTLATGSLAWFLYRLHQRKIALRPALAGALAPEVLHPPATKESQALLDRIRSETAF